MWCVEDLKCFQRKILLLPRVSHSTALCCSFTHQHAHVCSHGGVFFPCIWPVRLLIFFLILLIGVCAMWEQPGGSSYGQARAGAQQQWDRAELSFRRGAGLRLVCSFCLVREVLTMAEQYRCPRTGPGRAAAPWALLCCHPAARCFWVHQKVWHISVYLWSTAAWEFDMIHYDNP